MEFLQANQKTPEEIKADFLAWRKPTCDPVLDAMRQARREAREQAELAEAQTLGEFASDQADVVSVDSQNHFTSRTGNS